MPNVNILSIFVCIAKRVAFGATLAATMNVAMAIFLSREREDVTSVTTAVKHVLVSMHISAFLVLQARFFMTQLALKTAQLDTLQKHQHLFATSVRKTVLLVSVSKFIIFTRIYQYF